MNVQGCFTRTKKQLCICSALAHREQRGLSARLCVNAVAPRPNALVSNAQKCNQRKKRLGLRALRHFPLFPRPVLDNTADTWPTSFARTTKSLCCAFVRTPTDARSAQTVLVLLGKRCPSRRPGFHNICLHKHARVTLLRSSLWPHYSPPSHPPPPPLRPSAARLSNLEYLRTLHHRRIGEFDSIEALPAAAGHCSTPEPPPPVSQQP